MPTRVLAMGAPFMKTDGSISTSSGLRKRKGRAASMLDAAAKAHLET
jgi:hypothetical protein